ncbi:hypothetical protein C8D91_0325 [Marinicella litoralis]|uniref:Uncharacterized protein n=1 Tax=Marinicella litoralis TaxID=644220 RepID=A0A4R6XYR6_9GAMM|nr:hypothetical protein C8D91_0325 [Marinicella litoralis]
MTEKGRYLRPFLMKNTSCHAERGKRAEASPIVIKEQVILSEGTESKHLLLLLRTGHSERGNRVEASPIAIKNRSF